MYVIILFFPFFFSDKFKKSFSLKIAFSAFSFELILLHQSFLGLWFYGGVAGSLSFFAWRAYATNVGKSLNLDLKREKDINLSTQPCPLNSYNSSCLVYKSVSHTIQGQLSLGMKGIPEQPYLNNRHLYLVKFLR